MRDKKEFGSVYTPIGIVREMLDMCGYTSVNPDILRWNVIDNSCGDGAFLTEIVGRLISAYGEGGRGTLRNLLENLIHGIEIDGEECVKCVEALDRAVAGCGLDGRVKWDIRCADALTCHDFDKRMDLVIGNPPYVRIQNIKKNKELYGKIKSYSFCSKGSSDMYIAFYELGLNMLSRNGTLCYISPTGWMKGPAGAEMREQVRKRRLLAEVVDFGYEQVFEGSTSYVSINRMNFRFNLGFAYSRYGSAEKHSVLYENAFIGGELYLSEPDDLRLVNEIESARGDKYRVKNGIATLLDDFFIYDDEKGFGSLEIPALKASTGERKTCLFPHALNGDTLPLDSIREISEPAYAYITDNRDRLEKRDYDGEWYGIGRKQGLADMWRHKVSVNNIIRDKNDLKINFCVAGSIVYSGYYILLDDISEEGINGIIAITRALTDDDFMRYVKAIGKHKSGGYYTFTAKNLQKYLNWKMGTDGK